MQRVTRLSITPGSIARAAVLVAAWLVVVTVLARARGPLVLFFFGFALAAITYPLVQRLGRRMPTWIAIVLVSVIAALLAAVVGVNIYDEVNRQAQDLSTAVDQAVTSLEDTPRYSEMVDRLDLRDRADEFSRTLVEDVSFSGSRLTEMAPSLASGAGDVFIIWLFAVMLLAAGPQFVRSFVALFPSPVTRRRVDHVIRAAHLRSARFLGFMFLRAIAFFLLTLALASALDLRVPTILATVVAVMSFVPRFGVVIGALPVALVAALRSPDLVVPVLVIAVGVQALDAVFLQPRIESHSVPVGALALLVATILGWALEGTWGIMLGYAVAAFVVAAVDQGLAIRDGEVPDPGLVPDVGPPPEAGSGGPARPVPGSARVGGGAQPGQVGAEAPPAVP